MDKLTWRRIIRPSLVKYGLAALCGVVGWVAVVSAQGTEVKSRWPTNQESGSYIVKRLDSGKTLWKVDWKTQVRQEGELRLAEILEQGDGQPLGYDAPVTWEKRLVLRVAPTVELESLDGQRWNQAGQLIDRLEVEVNRETRKIRYRDTGKKEPRWRTLRWTQKTFPDEFLFHWARTLDFEASPAGECLLLLSPSRKIRMKAYVRGTETITTPAGTFSCYRVELVPSGMLKLPVVNLLAPEMLLWVTTDYPHFWVRYIGAIGGPGAPEASIELIQFSRS